MKPLNWFSKLYSKLFPTPSEEEPLEVIEKAFMINADSTLFEGMVKLDGLSYSTEVVDGELVDLTLYAKYVSIDNPTISFRVPLDELEYFIVQA